MNKNERALIVLSCNDYESLQITLLSLDQTVDTDELIVIILNGIGTVASNIVERVARLWASSHPHNRFVVRPKCSGAKAFYAIREILANFRPLSDRKFICKIDDDIIPLRKGWLTRLGEAFLELSSHSKVGFVSGLINNNSWGFNEMLDIFGKREEYRLMYNYRIPSRTPEKFSPGQVDCGAFGTIWQDPYLSWWLHQWSSLVPGDFVSATQKTFLYKEIPPEIEYSIGCIFFKKDFWLTLNEGDFHSDLDEEIMHHTCLNGSMLKFALLQEPMIHLFYFTQRIANRDLIGLILQPLSEYFDHNGFLNIQRNNDQLALISVQEGFNRFYADFLNLLQSLNTE